MKKFNADRFLSNLIDDVVSSAREGKQFEADPSILGPLLLTVQEEHTVLTRRYEALKNEFWQVRKGDDSKWRVYSAAVSSEVLDGQQAGFDSSEEALDAAILRCTLSVNTE
jgi:hypothetical protein